MAKIVNQATVDAESLSQGVTVKHLITPARVGADCVRSEILELKPGAEAAINVDRDDLSWAHILDGVAQLSGEAGAQEISADHFVFTPPGFAAQLTTESGVRLFRATVPRAARFDARWAPTKLDFRCVDWTREPVLDSEHDARKRIYLVTPKLSGTDVVKGEMILYPAGTAASSHHHEGADHFQYILRGSATFFLNEEPHRVSAGDTVYIYENERHYFVNDGDEEMTFIEYFVPGKYKTIWAENAPICTWLPTGKNIMGGTPSREIGAHSSAEVDQRRDV
jgi:quercetin dioxygenase-like cupin family protein